MIALIDYGAGNLTSVRKAFAALGSVVVTPTGPHDLPHARGIVIPGVGHFDRTRSLDAGWRDAILRRIAAGVPVFGICLGLQWLFEGSEESPDILGLGLFTGRCRRLEKRVARPTPFPLKVPHVGWNSLAIPKASGLLNGVPETTQVYFTHSYAAPVVNDTAAVTEYGLSFSAAVERDNIAAVQFHPEKSGEAGLQILRNWIAGLKPRAT